ncbi:helix-turn-helix domain-containing protein [Paenibacillus sp. 2RAB27]|uniref:helix-turn-helix domain-containing protein n=1 Tax=Paenibacillus sp. 2RAB27 TaxID=3232991 RepID=UPI003F95A76E
MNSTFGKRVKKLRMQLGWTQPELAEKLDVSLPLIKNYEGDTRSPSIDKLNKLCDLFGVSSDYLLCRTDELMPAYVPNDAVLSFDKNAFSDEQLKFIEAFLEAFNKR